MKALITQRESKDNYGVLIDVLESTYVNFFEALGVELTIVSNFHSDIAKKLNLEKYDFVILTGGGSIKPEYYDKVHNDTLQNNRDIIEYAIIEKSTEQNIPILAICRGMQYINGIFGGKISKLDFLKNSRGIGKDHPILLGNKTIWVNNYHNDGIYLCNLASQFKVIALDKGNKVVEGYYSGENKILGIQWHPERNFKCVNSYNESKKLVESFIKNGGVLDESYYISCRSRD